uniref:Uncharacterized protein n=1 Tax=Ditylum brightwellii TaxID=49249 RepID=A0A7S1YSG5_9STRA|mmetsp:Transcript_16169/g.23968  ORF Transcript_16169/g.23968 Transcript_16169/m.23968 type:complete len:219 (+) Transcript_16169:462-1118(+)
MACRPPHYHPLRYCADILKRVHFKKKDEGDKTVGFVVRDVQTAVFYEKQLMSVVDALTLAAETVGKDNSCGLIGHALVSSEEEGGELDIFPVEGEEEDEFGRYFVPAYFNSSEDEEEEEEVSIQNLGQFCNDLAWNVNTPPPTLQDYNALSTKNNAVQLIWRLEYDTKTNCLIPTWPVSVITSMYEEGVEFTNEEEFMELGTQYGWNYWQAVVDLENV